MRRRKPGRRHDDAASTAKTLEPLAGDWRAGALLVISRASRDEEETPLAMSNDAKESGRMRLFSQQFAAVTPTFHLDFEIIFTPPPHEKIP